MTLKQRSLVVGVASVAGLLYLGSFPRTWAFMLMIVLGLSIPLIAYARQLSSDSSETDSRS